MAALSSSDSSIDLVRDWNPAIFQETGATVDQYLVEDLADLVIDYLFGPQRFGQAAYFHFFKGINSMSPEPKIPRALILFWNQLDPIDPTQQVWQTHFPPVLCPQFVNEEPFNLRVLGTLVQNPQNGGHASGYVYQSTALDQCQNIPVESSNWLVLRKEVWPHDSQNYWQRFAMIQNLHVDYELDNSGLHLATVLFTRYVETGEQLPNTSPIRCKETVDFSYLPHRQQLPINIFPLVVGSGIGTNGLLGVGHGRWDSPMSIATLRKF